MTMSKIWSCPIIAASPLFIIYTNRKKIRLRKNIDLLQLSYVSIPNRLRTQSTNKNNL